ncbi:MAG: transporter integral rane subunit, partial [Glaciihabitans sp.]|nr:transporter integral rane subunit [Glaciihabitans sp.]
MTAAPTAPNAPSLVVARSRSRFLGSIYAGNSHTVLSRSLLATKTSNYWVVLSGFFEPIFYLLSLGIGLGSLIGTVTTATGAHIPYAAYIAPALLAVSAMNGAVYDATWNVFFKMQYAKLYEGMLATSLGPLDVALGEISYALLRGLLYAAGFMVVMQIFGLNLAWTAILALPAVVIIAFGFASLGMAVTSYMKTFQQMDWINFVMLPMFIFSATFYPITVYPVAIQWLIQAMPLWHGVELVRGLTTGDLSP